MKFRCPDLVIFFILGPNVFWFLSLKWSEVNEALCVLVREFKELVPYVSHCRNHYDVIVEHAQYALQTWHALWSAWLVGTVSVQYSYTSGCTNIQILRHWKHLIHKMKDFPLKKKKKKNKQKTPLNNSFAVDPSLRKILTLSKTTCGIGTNTLLSVRTH